MHKVVGFALAMSLASVASAQQRVDLAVLDDAMPGPRTQVLVLGSVHLSQGEAAQRFDPASLEPLLQRLAAFRPDTITIEALPGETCALMRLRAAYKDLLDYCPDVAEAKAATGLDALAALDAIDLAYQPSDRIADIFARRRAAREAA